MNAGSFRFYFSNQDEAVVRKKTQQKVRLIENEAREVRRNATAKASFVSGKAETDAQFLVRCFTYVVLLAPPPFFSTCIEIRTRT